MNLFKHAQEIVMAEETTKLFLERSINEVTIKDIANHIGVGEATIYRHYKTKFNIVLSVANYLMNKVFSQYFNFEQGNTGYEKIAEFYRSFLNIYKDNCAYYKFISEFDAFLMNNNEKTATSYEAGIEQFKNKFDEIYQLGLKDGSVKEINDIDVFYYSTTHALLELCKKLANKDIISQDAKIDKVREIEVLIETILYRFK